MRGMDISTEQRRIQVNLNADLDFDFVLASQVE